MIESSGLKSLLQTLLHFKYLQSIFLSLVNILLISL